MKNLRSCSGGGAAKCLFLFFIFASSLMGCTRQSEVGNQVVVQVDEVTLNAATFGKALAARLKNYDAIYAKEESNVRRLKEEIVSEFITSAIMQKFAKESGLPSPEAEVEAQVNKVRSSYPDDISFRSALAEGDISLEAWTNAVRSSLYEKMIFQSVAKKVSDPTEEEIATYYKGHKNLFEVPARVRLRQIVLEKEEDAKRVLARLKQAGSSSMERLAREFSVAPEGKNGGDTGWIEKGALEVFDIAFKMSIGARSEIIKSSYGFHIFEVIGKKAASQQGLGEAKSKIVASLRAEKEKDVFQSWLEEQIKKANIKRDENLITSIKVHTEH